METRKQQILVIAFACFFLIVASIASTWLIKTGRIGGDSAQEGYRNVTSTHAVLACEQDVKDKYSDKIITLEVDNHSSRFDSKLFVYKIFLKANMASKKNRHGSLYYINCFVRSSDGAINKFEVLEETEQETEAVTGKDTNAFGWPK